MRYYKTPIELELRAEFPLNRLSNLKRHFEKIGRLDSHTRRLSVMSFGNLKDKKIDIRIRVTNGRSEVVVKSGSSHGARDRIEVVQPISGEQFIGFVKVFTQFGFVSKVGERETFNYSLPNNIIASLVVAGPFSYLELEKISSPKRLKKDTEELRNTARQLRLNLLTSEKKFNELCKRLDEKVDWLFNGSVNHYKRLEERLKNHLKKR